MNPGDVVDNETLRSSFSVGNMGGMRRSLQNNALVIVSDHTKGLYDDHWDGDVLHYTGMGKRGAQTLNGNQNRTLFESRDNGVAIHLFEVFEAGRYIYAGEVDLAAEPYQEEQPDEADQPRSVWMFPVKLKPHGLRPLPNAAVIRKLEAAKERALSVRAVDDLKRLAKKAKPKPVRRPAAADQFVRNPYVAAYVKKAANGHCDLCKLPAPFESNGEPFLHCHHVMWLARGGPDIIQNTVAICPNCHERMHQLDRKPDIEQLAIRITQRDPDLAPIDLFSR